MYRLLFQGGTFNEKVVATNLPDLDHCEMEIARYCDKHNYNPNFIKTWVDDEHRYVYNLDLTNNCFICEEE